MSRPFMPSLSGTRVWWSFVVTTGALLALTGGGYLVFRAFAASGGPLNLYLLAVAAGTASFFSPCAFPLLPGYLSFYHNAHTAEAFSPKAGQVLASGTAAALGVVTFDLILGLLIALLGTGVAQGLSISGPEPSGFVRLFRGVVGVVLLLLGAAQLHGINLKPTLADALAYHTRPRLDQQRRPALTLYLYGLGYNAAGMGCTGPILAGLMLAALASGGFQAAFTAFLIFSLTMAGLMLVVSALVSSSQQQLVQRLKSGAPHVKRGAAVLLMLIGLFNLATSARLDLFVQLLFP